MKRVQSAIFLALALAAGAYAQGPAGGRAIPEGREGREAARECFELAQTIRATDDADARAALTEQLREKVSERRAARIEADKRRVARAEREIAERHEAALRALDAIKERLAEAEARQAEDVEREVESLLAGKEGFPPRGPGGLGFGLRGRLPDAAGAEEAPATSIFDSQKGIQP